jgi:hypothetical protein
MLYVFLKIISTANNLAVSSRSQGLYILKIRSNKIQLVTKIFTNSNLD